ncbi:MAG: hypothetical protein ACON3Z_15925 [Bradymonadia bacterium]
MKRLMITLIALSLAACAQQSAETSEVLTTSPPPSNPTGEMTRGEQPESPVNPMTETAAVPVPEAVNVQESGEQDVSLAAPFDAERMIVPRPRKRLNVDQLRASMLQVSGGIDWTEGSGNRMRYLFEDLALTLGRPDFAESTDEDLEPTLLFQKFLGDAARNICLKMIDADLAAHRAIEAGEPTEWTPRLLVHVGPNDTLSSNPDGVRANMQTLLQSFHGRRLSVDAPGLVHWHWLFESASFVTEQPAAAWAASCVALFTHPDFYLY